MVDDIAALNCYLVAEHSTEHWAARSFALDLDDVVLRGACALCQSASTERRSPESVVA
jgi:hypothetical protein